MTVLHRHGIFVMANKNFSVVEKHYSVEIPVAEIAYIYDFIEANQE